MVILLFDRAMYLIKKKIWLSAPFRVSIIREGIEKAEGINRLARILGYRSRIHPAWPLRQILAGRQPFPFERLQRLASFLGYDMTYILRHAVSSAKMANDNVATALSLNGFSGLSN